MRLARCVTAMDAHAGGNYGRVILDSGAARGAAAPQPPDPARVADAVARYRAYQALLEFRASMCGYLAAWADALFGLCDAILCTDHAAASLVHLSLEAEFARGHGALVMRWSLAGSTRRPSPRCYRPPAGVLGRPRFRAGRGRRACPDHSGACRRCRPSRPTTASSLGRRARPSQPLVAAAADRYVFPLGNAGRLRQRLLPVQVVLRLPPVTTATWPVEAIWEQAAPFEIRLSASSAPSYVTRPHGQRSVRSGKSAGVAGRAQRARIGQPLEQVSSAARVASGGSLGSTEMRPKTSPGPNQVNDPWVRLHWSEAHPPGPPSRCWPSSGPARCRS
jgi:hypothetical protein